MRTFGPRSVKSNETASCCPIVAADVSARSSLQVAYGAPWECHQDLARNINTMYSILIGKDLWG
jgi:hypothetical protein